MSDQPTLTNLQILTSPIPADLLPEIGGKARQLEALGSLPVTIPSWLVIPASLVEELQQTGAWEQATIQILQHGPPWLRQVSHVAVRSSALVEDGAKASFAGQFKTLLQVPKENLPMALREVAASAQAERVAAYANQQQITSQPGIAIILQEMVAAEVAGVAFGVHPVSGDRQQKVINAVFGLGEGLVTHDLPADQFIVQANGVVQSTILSKTQAYVPQKLGGGIHCIAVPREQQQQATLTNPQVYQLAQLLEQLAELFGQPQDIEFALKNNQLYLLQSRPITTLGQLPDRGGQRIVWDNSNIIESYPGITAPLTFSFIKKVYEAVYWEFSKLMGVRPSTLESNASIFANMLGLLNGRVYYNLASWYQVLALFPGYSVNARFMETMMGVKERFDLPPHLQPKGKNRWGFIRSLLGLLRGFFRLPKQRRAFLKLLDRELNTVEHFDFKKARPEALMQLFQQLEGILLKNWKAPLVNDFFVMIFFGLHKGLTAKWISADANVHNDLLAGSRDIISTEPAERIIEMLDLIRSTPEYQHWFQEKEPMKIWQQLRAQPETALTKAVDAYLQKFGDRCSGELKLENPTYRQYPERLMQLLQTHLQATKTTRPLRFDHEVRESAEAQVRQALKRKPLRRWFYRYLLRQTRTLVSQRENLRFERTRVFGLVRRIFQAIGQRWQAEGILQDAKDIFYLTKEEIFAYINGTAVSAKPQDLVLLRRQEYAAWESLPPPPDRVETYGMVYHANNFYASNETQHEAGADLEGIGCCPGLVRGRVRVVHDPTTVPSLEGDILVTTTTDPSWVLLFPSAGGILVERGSLLSHSAIVAREMGIPCIVSVHHLLHQLQTGDWIEMDGSSGKIRRINQPESKAHEQ